MTGKLPRSRAVGVPTYEAVRQPLSGYHLGYKGGKMVWKAALMIGGLEYLSRRDYRDATAAELAAERALKHLPDEVG